MPHRAMAVANYFIRLSKDNNIPLTNMQLLKLVYIAHGWNLAINNEPLLIEKIEAWKYGPVVHPLFDAFKKYGVDVIDSEEKDPLLFKGTKSLSAEKNFTPSEKEVLNAVFDNYAKYDGFKLSKLTHEQDTPWDKAYKSQKRYIPNEVIKEHFVQLAENYAETR